MSLPKKFWNKVTCTLKDSSSVPGTGKINMHVNSLKMFVPFLKSTLRKGISLTLDTVAIQRNRTNYWRRFFSPLCLCCSSQGTAKYLDLVYGDLLQIFYPIPFLKVPLNLRPLPFQSQLDQLTKCNKNYFSHRPGHHTATKTLIEM